MKKIICLLLCLVMLLSSVALLASCKDKEDPPEETGIVLSENTLNVDISQYSVVYGKSVSSDFKSRVMDFVTAITDATNATIRPKVDSGDASNGNYEIILGSSARNESAQTLAEIKNNGWAIRVIPNMNKVIIIGTTEFLTTVAMDYFLQNYMNGDALSGATTIMHEKVTAGDVAMLKLVDVVASEDGSSKSVEGTFSVVYNQNMDDQGGSKNADKTREYGETSRNGGLDYPYAVAKNVKSAFTTLTRGVKQATMPLNRDSEDAAEREILVGNVDRTASQEVLADLGVNQYGVVIRDNTVVLGAHNDTTLASAYAIFVAMINMSVQTDAQGNSTISVPATYSRIESVDEGKWVTDFPSPDNVTLLDSMDVGSSALVQVFVGDGVSRDGFTAYCDKLEAEGYTVLSPETQMSDSSFVTYMHSGKGYILHVSHAAHKYAKAESVDEFVEAIRVVSASTKNVTVDKNLFNEDRSWTKRTNTMITQYEANRTVGAWGNQFIITLEDGSFIIFDGGHAGQTGSSNDEDRLYNVLVDLHTKVYGAEPTTTTPIRISAWLLSHEHGDHFGVFQLFCKEYGPSNLVTIERLIYNFASDDENYNSGNPETFVRTHMNELKSKADNFKDIKVHTGEKYYIANAEIHILYTHEDIYPQRVEFFNSSSTVYRISLGTTDAAIGSTVSKSNIAQTETLILLGDLERVGSLCLRSMYSTDIESTMVQVAHHGYNGCEEKLYQNINPIVVWWPTQNTQFLSQTRSDGKDWIRSANYGVAFECPRVKMIIVHGDYNTTLTLTKDGPDYENLYDAYENRIIEPDINPAPGEGSGNVIYRPNVTN